MSNKICDGIRGRAKVREGVPRHPELDDPLILIHEVSNLHAVAKVLELALKELDDRLILIHDKKVSLHAVAKVVELALKLQGL
uniref:Uncharacterized protein n=1 Tax=Oryza nivara TaxID=4536 RepID=A0A0E0J841_ORYNI